MSNVFRFDSLKEAEAVGFARIECNAPVLVFDSYEVLNMDIYEYKGRSYSVFCNKYKGAIFCECYRKEGYNNSGEYYTWVEYPN